MNKSIFDKKNLKTIVVIAIVIVFSKFVYFRIDMTSDKRFTLSEATIDLIKNNTVHIDVYLEGNFPSSFNRLRTETQHLLDEYKSVNQDVKIRYINPRGKQEILYKKGLIPSELTIEQDGVFTNEIIFPWAVVKRGTKSVNVSLLKEGVNQDQNTILENSVQALEYSFTKAIYKLIETNKKAIAVLSGNKQLDDIYIADFLQTINKDYHLAKFTLDSVAKSPSKTLKDLLKYDMLLIANPKEAFTEKEKYALDQYIMNGGKTMWLIDPVNASMDSLRNYERIYTYNNDLNITDMLFSYGLRVNYNIIKDLYSAKIPVAIGQIGDKAQYNYFNWNYFPLSFSETNHPIVNNIDPVKLQFVSGIDTLKNDIKKTVLLKTSKYSKIKGVPSSISLNELALKPKPEEYNNGQQNIALLLEGNFKSAYAYRTKPFDINDDLEKSVTSKMVIISDGDIMTNKINSKGKPSELGLEPWTGNVYGNKEFLKNTIDYMLNDSSLLEIRSKKIDIKRLNTQSVNEGKRFWQIINTVFPIVVIGLFAFGFIAYRQRKYSKML